MTQVYVPPAWPARSNCWLCGRFGRHQVKGYPRRECQPCGVRWVVRAPGEYVPNGYEDRAGKEELIRPRWKMRPESGITDIFDGLVDHAVVNIPSPA